MGEAYRLKAAGVLARVLTDLATGTNTAGAELRDVLDAAHKGGRIGEPLSDQVLAQFSLAWAVIAARVSSQLAGVEIDAERP